MGPRGLIWTSAASLSIFLAVVASQGIWVAGFDPARQQVSEYVHTSAGTVMVLGFLSWAVSLLALAGATFALRRDEAVSWLAYLQAGALLCAALGVVLLACFPTDRGAEIPGVVTGATSAGEIHDLASALVTASIFAAALAGAVRMPSSLRTLTLSLVLIAIGSSVIFLAIGDPVPGIRQRALLGAGCAWQIAWLWTSYRLATSTSPRSSLNSRCSTS